MNQYLDAPSLILATLAAIPIGVVLSFRIYGMPGLFSEHQPQRQPPEMKAPESEQGEPIAVILGKQRTMQKRAAT